MLLKFLAIVLQLKVVAYDANDMTMTPFQRKRGHDVRGVVALTLSPNKKYLAICDAARDGGYQITVHALESFQLIGRIGIHVHLPSSSDSNSSNNIIESEAKIFPCSFSGDSKHIITASRETLQVWTWDKEHLHRSVSCSSNTITRIQPAPNSSFLAPSSSSSCLFTTSGLGHLRAWHCSGANQQLTESAVMSSRNKEQHEHFLDHIWLPVSDTRTSKSYRLVVLARQSDTNSLKSNDGLQHVYTFKLCEMGQRPQFEPESIISVHASGSIVEAMAPFGSNFVLGGSAGFLCIYERNTDESQNPGTPFNCSKVLHCDENECFISLSVSQHSDEVVALSKSMRIFNVPMGDIQLEGTRMKDFLLPHHGPILSMDVCLSKPLVVTCGEDCSVRIW